MWRAVLAWEFFGPFLWLSPWQSHWCRFLGCVGIFLLHLAFGIGLRIEVPNCSFHTHIALSRCTDQCEQCFVYTGMVATWFLMPSWLWDTALPAVIRRLDRVRFHFALTRVLLA